MKISFIIPVYKVEKYLHNCIDSILNQTYKNFEIILVDDGSPDNSGTICDNYSSKYECIRTIHKPNGGAAQARNYGLNCAKGDYVIFVDGDDFWTEKTHLQCLINIIKQNPTLDFIGFNCSYYYSPKQYKRWIKYQPDILQESDKNSLITKLVRCGVFPMSPCLKIIKTRTLVKNDIYFPEGITGEDIPWFIDLLDRCKNFKFINLYIYAYRQDNTNSVSHNFTIKTFDDFIYIIQSELDKLPTRSFDDYTKQALKSFLGYEFCYLLAQIKKLPINIRQRKRDELLKYKWLLEYTENPKVKLVHWTKKIIGIFLTEKLLNLFMATKS